MAFQQATRALQVMTPFGADEIQLIGFEGEEEISRLGGFQLELISENPSLNPAQIVGQNITFCVTDNDDKTRFFNGFVNRFAAGAVNDDGIRRYRATVVPWLWFLTQTTDCRIFQDKTVIEIVEQIFQDLGFQDFSKSQVREEHPKREYCVQYRESDFDFVSRLLEEEGVFYFFEHQNGKHTLVLSDQSGAHETVEQSPVDYPNSDHYSWSIKPHLYTWESCFEFRTGKWAHTDYNFKAPRDRLMASDTGVLQLPGVDKFEAYEFPGEYEQKSVGKPLAKIRAEELACQHHLIETSSTCVSFATGGRFKIGKHRVASEEGKEYVIKKLTHRAFFAEAYETHGIVYQSDEPAYFNHITCFPHSIPFRPLRLTQRPVVRGCQTAVVTGPPGEEIYPDEFGRVKVQFHWDREGQYDDKSSCWIRVSQIHAGKGWGYMDLPRIGEEVIVDFLEGNPDQPIIVGRVYNGDNRPPFELPAGKTRRGNSTKTYKGAGFNEMSMDDTPGKEQIRIHGQYDMNTVVEHDETHTIHNNRTKAVDVDETMTIGNDQKLDVGVNRDVTVGSDHSESVGSNQTISIGRNQSTTVGKNQSLSVGKNQTASIALMQDETVGIMASKNIGFISSLSVGVSHSVSVGVMMSTSVGNSISESSGGSSSEDVGTTKSINAGDEVSIVCGASKFVMKKDGSILIEGKDIVIKASGKITAKANGDMVLKAAKIGQN